MSQMLMLKIHLFCLLDCLFVRLFLPEQNTKVKTGVKTNDCDAI